MHLPGDKELNSYRILQAYESSNINIVGIEYSNVECTG